LRKRRWARASGTSAIGALVEEFLSRSESRTRAKEKLAALIWRDVVGEFYADRTVVARVHHGIMYVGCESPALAHQLSLDAAEIAQRLNRELAGSYVKEIRPSTGQRAREAATGHAEVRRPRKPSRAELEAIVLPKEHLAAIESEAAQIADEEMRKRFVRAAVSDRRACLWRQAQGYRECDSCGWLLAPEMAGCPMCGGTAGPKTTDRRPKADGNGASRGATRLRGYGRRERDG
jgi:Dna[CI] antecedent, DciA